MTKLAQVCNLQIFDCALVACQQRVERLHI
jgi:hypothetical protein